MSKKEREFFNHEELIHFINMGEQVKDLSQLSFFALTEEGLIEIKLKKVVARSDGIYGAAYHYYYFDKMDLDVIAVFTQRFEAKNVRVAFNVFTNHFNYDLYDKKLREKELLDVKNKYKIPNFSQGELDIILARGSAELTFVNDDVYTVKKKRISKKHKYYSVSDIYKNKEKLGSIPEINHSLSGIFELDGISYFVFHHKERAFSLHGRIFIYAFLNGQFHKIRNNVELIFGG